MYFSDDDISTCGHWFEELPPADGFFYCVVEVLRSARSLVSAKFRFPWTIERSN